jgi:hypothetical protein
MFISLFNYLFFAKHNNSEQITLHNFNTLQSLAIHKPKPLSILKAYTTIFTFFY